jgi:hypothetical protein
MSIAPIRDIGRRLPQVGRIRTGRPGNRGPVALSKFRFTSPSRELISKVAELYGGTPQAWDTPKSDDRYEVYSEAEEIKVVLPADAFDRNWELWDGPTIRRRCDNRTCVLQVPGPEGPEPTECPCICQQRGVRECEPVSRLNVILPNVRGLGTWRLDTKSWNAAEEMPGMVDAIQAIDGGRGMVRAVLRIEPRHRVIETTKGKQRRNFMVPVLDFDNSLDEIAAGAARVSAEAAPLGPPTGPGPRELSPGAGGYRDENDLGDEEVAAMWAEGEPVIIDAEVVEDEVPIDKISEWLALLSARDRTRILRQARELADGLGEPIPANFDAITGRVLEVIWRGLNT